MAEPPSVCTGEILGFAIDVEESLIDRWVPETSRLKFRSLHIFIRRWGRNDKT